MTNPSIPPRFAAGPAYSVRYEEPEELRPPALTSQAREDVERLRAKVHAHHPGYIISNGVSLPSQIPSVPQLLDELAQNVAAARIDRAIPNTPLPEIEPSELAKAGFDWKSIADRAISALESGSRRPLPLANDPEAANVPGLDLIARMQVSVEEPAYEESPTAVAATELENIDSDAATQEVDPGLETAQVAPLEAESADTEAIAAWLDHETDQAEPVFPYYALPETSPAPQTIAPEVAFEPGAPEVPEATEITETAVPPAPPTADMDLATEDTWEVSHEPIQGELPAEMMTDYLEEDSLTCETEAMDLDDLVLDEADQMVFEDSAAGIPEAELPTEMLPLEDMEDLTTDRVYDDDVLENSGNDDERFVGDIEDNVLDESEIEALDTEAFSIQEEAAAEVPPAESLAPDLAVAELSVADELAQEPVADAALVEEIPDLQETPAPIETTESLAEAQPVAVDTQDDQAEFELPTAEPLPEDIEDSLNVAEDTIESLAESSLTEEMAAGEDLVGFEELDFTEVNLEELDSFATGDFAFEELEFLEETTQDSPILGEQIPDAAVSEQMPLPGSEAIGEFETIEEPSIETAQSLDDLDFLDTEEAEVAFPVDNTATDLGDDLSASLETSEVDGSAETESLSMDEAAEPGGDAAAAELSFQIPQVQGDIPQAMQEGFEDLHYDEAGVEELSFNQGSSFAEEPEVETGKKSFLQRLFGR